MLITPWTLSVLSLGVLTSSLYTLEGLMTPGFCPRARVMDKGEIFGL